MTSHKHGKKFADCALRKTNNNRQHTISRWHTQCPYYSLSSLRHRDFSWAYSQREVYQHIGKYAFYQSTQHGIRGVHQNAAPPPEAVCYRLPRRKTNDKIVCLAWFSHSRFVIINTHLYSAQQQQWFTQTMRDLRRQPQKTRHYISHHTPSHSIFSCVLEPNEYSQQLNYFLGEQIETFSIL